MMKDYQTPYIKVLEILAEGQLCVSNQMQLPDVNWEDPTEW